MALLEATQRIVQHPDKLDEIILGLTSDVNSNTTHGQIHFREVNLLVDVVIGVLNRGGCLHHFAHSVLHFFMLLHKLYVGYCYNVGCWRVLHATTRMIVASQSTLPGFLYKHKYELLCHIILHFDFVQMTRGNTNFCDSFINAFMVSCLRDCEIGNGKYLDLFTMRLLEWIINYYLHSQSSYKNKRRAKLVYKIMKRYMNPQLRYTTCQPYFYLAASNWAPFGEVVPCMDKKSLQRHEHLSKNLQNRQRNLQIIRMLHITDTTQITQILKLTKKERRERGMTYSSLIDDKIFWCQARSLAKNRCCQCCGKRNCKLKYCKGCKMMIYCSRKCQKIDWLDIHQYHCQRRKK